PVPLPVRGRQHRHRRRGGGAGRGGDPGRRGGAHQHRPHPDGQDVKDGPRRARRRPGGTGSGPGTRGDAAAAGQHRGLPAPRDAGRKGHQPGGGPEAARRAGRVAGSGRRGPGRPAVAGRTSGRVAYLSRASMEPTPPHAWHSGVLSEYPRRRARLRALPAAAWGLAAAPALSACTRASERLDAESEAVPEVDLSGIDEVPEIAELVPNEIRDRGRLVNGAALNYAPDEFVGSTGEAVGYDIDVLAAIGAVLGLDTRTEAAVFAQIIPAVGSTYDVGISSFTVNEERLEAVTMISYFQAGISYAVKAGNPYDIHPDDLCGKRVALQVGTYQEELSIERSQECRDAGEGAYDLLAYASNSDAAT